MSPAPPRREVPLYRPFALLAFGTALAGGVPVGFRMLLWLYQGADAVSVEWRLLHAHLQIVGFFATLIPGVAQHVLARFAGRPVVRRPLFPWLAALLAVSAVLRVIGTWAGIAPAVLVSAALETGAFSLFACWVWRFLDPPALGLLRRHLTASTGWLAAAAALEFWARWQTLRGGLAVPDLGAVRAGQTMALFGGVLGWVIGVLLRAGPMFVPSWRLPPRAARLLPWLLASGVALAAAAEMAGQGAGAAEAMARFGELTALGAVLGVLVLGGAFRPGGDALPMLARSPEESRIFRLAAASAALAVPGLALSGTLAWVGAPGPLLNDAVRHLVTVGFLSSVVVAMSFRLIPVLESRALPWPGLRPVAFWALLAGVLSRSAQLLVGLGWTWLAPLVAVSGVLVWIALGSVALSLIVAIASPRAVCS